METEKIFQRTLSNFSQLRPTLSNSKVPQDYNVIGLMSGSSLDGLDIAYVRLTKCDEGWSFKWLATDCTPYNEAWADRLRSAVNLSARGLAYLHADYGHYLGLAVRRFVEQRPGLPVADLVASHGHTVFHDPARRMSCQVGDGAAIAAESGIAVVSDLRSMDIAFSGQGAPIVPVGEQLLFPGFDYYLNLGGIANITRRADWIAYDVCACNQVLNHIAAGAGMAYDPGGELASTGRLYMDLLQELNEVSYHRAPLPKSLDNSFSIREIIPRLQPDLRNSDLLRTVTEHIAVQVVAQLLPTGQAQRMLITGGGALNTFLIRRIRELAAQKQVEVVIPERRTIEFKEALVMALLGALRIRGEATVLSSVTGAAKNSCGGALWAPAAISE